MYLNPSAQLGGAEMALLDLLASLRAAEPGWSLRLVVTAEGPLTSRAEALGVPATVVPFPPALARLGDAGAGGPAGNQVGWLALLGRLSSATPAATAYVGRLRRVLRDMAPDVLHTNGLKMHILGVWARPRPIPVIWHIHDYVRPRPITARLLRGHAARCAAVVANSRSVAEDVRAVCRDRVRVHAVYNGIDVKRFFPTGPALDLDALAGLPPAPPGTVRVGLVATLARWKGHDTFLQAMARLPASLPVRGYVVGGPLYQTDGSQHTLADLRQRAAQLGLSHRVGFTGFVEEPAAAIRALAIVVHASTQPEPFGLVIVEAMACGRPVIVSEAGGAAELVAVGTNALGHPPGDAALLAERITQLATNADLRSKLGEIGRATVEQRFDRRRLATELIPIYRDVTSSRR